MRKGLFDKGEILTYCLGAPRKIDYKSTFPYPGNSPGKHGVRGYCQRLCPHGFCKTGRLAVNNRSSRFWSNVPRGEAGSACGIHNDYKLDNVVVRTDNPSEIIGILDWEMATIGDPVMDIGNSLAYRVEPDDPDELKLLRFMPPPIEYALTRRELVDLYRAKTGFSFDDINFFYCFGLFRLAVIAQQIYYRYYHRQTSDERFQMMILAVRILEKAALKTIGTGFH